MASSDAMDSSSLTPSALTRRDSPEELTLVLTQPTQNVQSLNENTVGLFTELPDQDQQLFVQIYLDHFHFFPRLPIELRLLIWGLCFPTRLTILFCWGRSTTKKFNRYANESLWLPITSRINQESRKFTSQRYNLLNARPEPSINRPARRIWFSPKHEKLAFLMDHDFLHDTLALRFAEEHRDILSKVTNFTFLIYIWGSRVNYGLTFAELSILQKLSSLETLVIIRSKPKTNDTEPFTEQNQRLTLKATEGFCMMQHIRNPSFKIPKIYLKDINLLDCGLCCAY